MNCTWLTWLPARPVSLKARRPARRRIAPGRRLGLVLLALALGACTYYPPPEVTLKTPKDGTFAVGYPLTLNFSEPVDPATLAIRVWPADARNIEGEIPAGATPLLGLCRLADAPCGDANLTLSDDGTSAQVELARGTLGKPGRPLILEVAGNLASAGGADRGGVPAYFDVEFKPQHQANTEPVAFDNGHYIIVAQIQKPLPAVITLVSDFQVIPDGTLAMAAARGRAIAGAPKNTTDPSQIEIDSGSDGFGVFSWGFVQQTDGTRYVDTDPLDVKLSIGLVVVIHDIRINGTIVKNPTLGTDQIQGTVSFSGITLNPGDNQTDYPAGSTSFTADRTPDDMVPAGAPEVCGDLCGAVTAQCKPPFGFPGANMCP